jgi:hypothetical protein
MRGLTGFAGLVCLYYYRAEAAAAVQGVFSSQNILVLGVVFCFI